MKKTQCLCDSVFIKKSVFINKIIIDVYEEE